MTPTIRSQEQRHVRGSDGGATTEKEPGGPTVPEQYRHRLCFAAIDFYAEHHRAPTRDELLALDPMPRELALRHIKYLVKHDRLTLSK